MSTTGFSMAPPGGFDPNRAPAQDPDEEGAGTEGRLPDDATVDVAAERAATDVDRILGRLDTELVGLVPVKTRIREIASLLLVDRLRRKFGLDTRRPSRSSCR